MEIKTVALEACSEIFVESMEVFAFFSAGICGVHESVLVLSRFRLGLEFGFVRVGGNAVSSGWELAASGTVVISTSKASESSPPSPENGTSVLS